MSNSLRIIGDVHGKYAKYLPIIKDTTESIQIGDFGFDYRVFKNINRNHRFFGGNHDNYTTIGNCKNNLGDFGIIPNHPEMFFVRGAFSVDKKWRTPGVDWWEEEELNDIQFNQCTQEYTLAKPEIVLTHECPYEISQLIGNPGVLKYFGLPEDLKTQTNQWLQRLFDIHRPKLWIFGHFHTSWNQKIKGTDFRCLAELEYINL